MIENDPVRYSNIYANTLASLGLIDQDWQNYAEIRRSGNGIQIDIGGFREKNPYCASIILNELSFGRGELDLYEVRPEFRGKTLRQLGLYSDDVVRKLELATAMKIAKATLSKDESELRSAILSIEEVPLDPFDRLLLENRISMN